MPFDSTTYCPSTIDILRRARDGIATPGRWISGKMVEGDALCAAGWLRDALCRYASWFSAAPAMQCLFPNSQAPFNELVNFNDAPGRTQEEVVALFDEAIERAQKYLLCMAV